MRKTALEILSPDVCSDERHDWLATATLKELSEYLRWAKTESSWAQHGRDWLNIVLAKENIKLQTAIKRLTIWIFILTFVMALIAFCQFYKDFINLDNTVTNTTNIKTAITNPTNTDKQPNMQNKHNGKIHK